MRLGQNADTYLRYSNTVLVSLNNRIYLRDHISCGRGNAKVFPVTDMSFPTSETPRCSAVPGTYPPASDCESFPVYTISEREDVNSSKSNDTHKNWILVCFPVTTVPDSNGSFSPL